ncbi:MAG: helix-turn-helix domain-containing protein [Saprospiraceae bacterium]|nr:helix-turn-helix domain-containing protein [Saprospiraceae bacterium]
MNISSDKKSDPNESPVNYTIRVIGGKWKPLIIWAILNGTNRFGALQRALPNITKKMLTSQLRELEADGILHREVFPVVPPRVDYSLTEKGMTLRPLLEMMCHWGIEFQKKDK